MNELALFAGAGGGILGGKLLGWRTVCAVEWEPYAASVLAARQNDGLLPAFPVWDDVCTFDGRPWRGVVDVVSGGFPCQDISLAGKGAGIDGERSGLWREMARIVGEVRPRFVFVENSPALIARGLGRVLGDLAALGYDCRWTVLGAGDIGAPHQRDRFWLVAYADVSEWWQERGPCDRLAQPAHGLLSLGEEGASGFGAGREALAHANGLRELQPQGRKREQRRRAGNGGEGVADTHGQPWNEGRPSDAEEGQGGRDADRGGEPADLCHAHGAGLEKREGQPGDDGAELSATLGAGWWLTEPNVGRKVDGLA